MSMVQQFAFAWRRLARRPVSAAGIVLTLTLGIGIAVGMFSVLYHVVLQALPYPDGGRVVVIHSTNPETGVVRGQLTPVEAVEGLETVAGFEHTAYFLWHAFTYVGDGAPRNITSLHVSGDYFAVFGLPAALGRTLTPADVANRRDVIVLSHAAWMSLTGGDPDVIGATIDFRGARPEVVGVLPEAFAHPAPGQMIFTPINAAALAQDATVYRNARYMHAVGRISRDAAPDRAYEGLLARQAGVRDAHSLPDQGWRLTFTRLIDDTVGNVRSTLYALFAVAALVLLIACANTASLVSIRLEQRSSELAVRRALGASRGRIVADVALELAILASLAAAGGVLLAHAMIGVLTPLASGNLPRASAIAVDGAALGFAAAAALASVLLSGTAPLVRALRTGPVENLRGGTSREVRGGVRIAWPPVVGIGLSTLALVAALALVASLLRLSSVDPGFRTEGITALQLFRSDSAEVPRFVAQAREALEAVPGVREVAAVSSAPLSVVGRFAVDVVIQGRDQVEPIQANSRGATAGYHRFMGTPIVRGRDILDADLDGGPGLVVINETFARQVFGAEDPIGQVLMLPFGHGVRIPAEVVGVAADTRNAGLRVPTEPELVVPLSQFPTAGVTLLIDAAVAPPGWTRTLQDAVRSIDPDQAFFRSFTMQAELDKQLGDARFFATATGWFAVFALLLGAAGINAVVAAMQRRRAREIGLRMVLGASPREAARLVIGNALQIVALGVGLGALVALPAMNWLQGQLFGISTAAMGALFVATAGVLLAAGLLAAGWPAWRASRVAPMHALRYE
jgi:predicted permease